MTAEIESKKSDLEAKKTKAKGKIESLTSKTTELEKTIQSTTKTITTIKTKIESTTTTTTSMVKTREEKKNQLKVVSTSEKNKIQDEIDELTSQISSNNKLVDDLST